MKVLVTGATGFIGRHLAPKLLAAGMDVALLVRESYAFGEPLPPELAALRDQLQVVYADLRTFNLTARAVREAAPEAVIHLAAAGVNSPFLSLDTALRHNLNGTLNLLRACFESGGGPRQVITGRTPGELTAMNVYAASKAAAWAFCQMYARTQGWPVHGAMIFQAYGPGQPENALVPAALAAARAGENFPMTAGIQARDWIYVEDVAEGLVAALRAELPPGSTFDLGSGEATTVAEVARRIYDLVEERGLGRGGRLLLGALPDRPGEEAVQVADTGRTEELIGWRARVSLDEGLRRLL